MLHIRMSLGFVLLASNLMASGWTHDLYLGRGGYWKERVPVAIINRSTNTWHEASVRVAIPSLKAARPQALRLLGEGGTQLLYTVCAPGEFAVPVSLAPNAAAVYTFYANNDKAWGLPDAWPKKPDTKLNAEIVVGEKEQLTLAEQGEDTPWPTSGAWEYRVPIRVINSSMRPLTRAFASFPAREGLRATRNPTWQLKRGTTDVPCAVIGDTAFFFAEVPAQTSFTYWLYVKAGAATPAAVQDVTQGGLASEIPSDPRFYLKNQVNDQLRHNFDLILKSGVNLLKNSSFEKDTSSWQTGRFPKGVTGDRVAGGIFGMSAAHLVCAPGPSAATWKGWRQSVPVVPSRAYVYGAFVKATNTTAATAVHLHCLDARGHAHFGAAGGSMCDTGTLQIGGGDWMPLFGTVKPAAHIAAIELHLTIFGSGEVWHDGAFIAEAVENVCLGEPEPTPLLPAALQVGPVSPIVKVFPESAVTDTRTTFTLALARNETEDLQLAVKAKDTCDLTVEVENPCSAQGEKLKVEVGVVGLVPVDYPSSYYSQHTGTAELRLPNHSAHGDGFTGWWPDPVVATNRVHLPACSARAVRLAVTTTAQTPAGIYSGAVVWRNAKGNVVRRDAFQVNVWNFTLPARPAFAATYDVRFPRNQRTLWQRSGEKDMAGAQKRILDFMAKYKICPDQIDTDPIFTRDAQGQVQADFTAYDKAAEKFFNHYQFPNAYTPRIFYLFGWGHPPKVFLKEAPYAGTWPYKDVPRDQLRPEYVRTFQQALKLYWEHIKAKGWDKKVALYISDEPYLNDPDIRLQMKALCKMIHAVDPAIRIYSSTWRHCPDWNDSLDIWGVGAYGCFPVEEMQRLVKVGHSIWFTTDGQQCLDTPVCAIERLQPLYCWAYGAEKYEFWGCNWLTYDPWKFGWHSFIRQSGKPGETYWVRYPNGDGYHIYPPVPGSSDARPESSLRLCAIRDGVEEFSYWEMLAACASDKRHSPAQRAQAARLCARARAVVPIPNAGGRRSTHILPEVRVLDNLREQVGAFLSRLGTR